MTLPASIRINVPAPFPSRAQGSSYISVTKSGGVFTIGVDYTKLLPLAAIANPAIKEVVIVDTVTGVFNTFTVAALAAAAASIVNTSGLTGAILNTFRIVTIAGDVTILAADAIILMDKAVGAATNIILPTSASRQGVPVTAKDIKGDAATNNITFVPATGETIDGFTAAQSIANGVAVVDINYGKKTLFPLSSGGWYV